MRFWPNFRGEQINLTARATDKWLAPILSTMMNSDTPDGTASTGYHQRTTLFDPRSLAAFRIVFGCTLLLNLYLRTKDGRLEAFYSESGVLPLRALLPGTRWSFLDAFTGSSALFIAMLLTACIYAAYTVGYATKYTKWLVVAVLVSLYHRNPLVDDGSDWVMRLIALWTAFLPLGAVWSIDARIRKNRDTSGEPYTALGTVGFKLNLAALYLLNTLQKESDIWWHGDAVRRVLWDPWVVTPLAVGAREGVFCNILPALNYGTLGIEALIGILVLASLWSNRFTALITPLMLTLHLGFALFLYLGTFVPVYCACSLLFIPTSVWERIKFLPQARPMNSRRSWFLECFALYISVWFALQIVANNPLFPKSLSSSVSSSTPTLMNQWSQLMMISQQWFMFKRPSTDVSTALLAAETADGTVVDPLRDITFEPEAPFSASRYLGKYWVSYLFRLSLDGYAQYRSHFADYIFSLGYDSLEVSVGTLEIPSACGMSAGQLRIRKIFSASKPVVINPSSADVVHEETRSDAFGDQKMSTYGGSWKTGKQLHATLTPTHPKLAIRFYAPQECQAEVSVFFTKAPDYGRFVLSINDSAPSVVDLYSGWGVVREEIRLGINQIRRGENRLTLSLDPATPRDPSRLGFDELEFSCLAR